MSRKLHQPSRRFQYVAGNIPVGSLIRLCLVIFLIIFLVGKMSGREAVQPAVVETQNTDIIECITTESGDHSPVPGNRLEDVR